MELNAQKLIELFKLNLINSKDADVLKVVQQASINRVGLELASKYNSKYYKKAIIGWGTKENHWISQFPDEAVQILKEVLWVSTPLIILSQGVTEKVQNYVIEAAKDYSIPVVRSDFHLSVLNSTIGTFLLRHFAPQTRVHGSLVVVNGVGVLLTGKSAIGKSEAVLELIEKGHTFVSDDTVIIKNHGEKFIGEPAPLTYGLLEARGIGVINIPYIYGMKSFKKSVEIELVAELCNPDDIEKIDRLGTAELAYSVFGTSISKMQIPIYKGRSISSLIEAAVNVFLARQDGLDPLEEFELNRKKFGDKKNV